MADEIPEGMSPDARATWPSRELIESFLGDSFAVEMWPGETIEVDSAGEAAAAREFRAVLSRVSSGVTVVAAVSGGQPVGMTCQSFMSVSLQPPLVMFSPAKSSGAWPLMHRSGSFCVNFLAEDQADVSNQLAGRGIDPATVARVDKFEGIDWAPTRERVSPFIKGCVGYVDCRIHAVHDACDHYLVIGRVLDLAETDAEHGLTFYRGKYGSTR